MAKHSEIQDQVRGIVGQYPNPIDPALHAHLLIWLPRFRDLLEMQSQGQKEFNGMPLQDWIAGRLHEERQDLKAAIGPAKAQKNKQSAAASNQIALFKEQSQ